MIDTAHFPKGGLFIPANEPGSDWLLIAIHGSNGSCADFEGLEEIFGIPELNYLYLNGPIQSFSHYRWYDSPNTRRDAYVVLEDVFSYAKKQGYPPSHTFLMGFSQGAALTIEFGARHAERLAGYIALSGRVESLPSLLVEADDRIVRNGDFLITHGTQDYNLGVDVIRQQVEQMRHHGFHIDYQEYDKIHEFDAKNELPYIRDWVLKHM